MAITATGYPSTTVLSFATPETNESSEIIKYLVLSADDFIGDEYIDVEYNGETVRVYIVEECRYAPIEVHFINKEGAQQTLVFFKAREDRMRINKEDYESDQGQPGSGFHQYIDYNVNARSSFKINSGFVEESMNDTFKQLFLSSRIWVIEDGTSSNFIPINIKSTSLTYKNRQKDRLISYEVEFEYSYNDINNI